MDNKRSFTLSVHELIEFSLRSGSLLLSEGVTDITRAQIGSRIHRKLQRKWEKNGTKTEVFLKKTIDYPGYSVTVEGRADGISCEDGLFTIEEIKTVERVGGIEDELTPLHRAQGMCYAYFYACDNDLPEIGVRIIYVDIKTGEQKSFLLLHTFNELENFFQNALDIYNYFLDFTFHWQKKRGESSRTLTFPYERFRNGQRELAGAVYRTIMSSSKENRQTLLVRAPTGTGKTISTLFPAVKAMGEGAGDRIFYLTAKTTTREIAANTVTHMRAAGLLCKSIVITSKEKICINDVFNCSPRECLYAFGHYDHVNSALQYILKLQDDFSAPIIRSVAEQRRVCPFELQLDLSLWCDIIICDYNYLFDPLVCLKRYFADYGDFIFLIDEAHNLLERGRDMYTCGITKKGISAGRKLVKDHSAPLSKALLALTKELGTAAANIPEDEKYTHLPLPHTSLIDRLELVIEHSNLFLNDHDIPADIKEGYKELYFEMSAFLKIHEMYTEDSHVTYLEKREGLTYKLMCTDPSKLLYSSYKKGRTTVLFSATLYPTDYWGRTLGASEDKPLVLPSPFSTDNRLIFIANDVCTTYQRRERYFVRIAEYINTLFIIKPGNYMIFFPSYKYLEDVYTVLTSDYSALPILKQEREFGDYERDAFLARFNEETPVIGLCVIGGVFGEGIDLTADRLIGAVVVGVSLPLITNERELIKQRFDLENKGFDYAYVYPGMSKVAQAAGRVIRTETDRGVILLLDERFLRPQYSALFPPEWYPYYSGGLASLSGVLKEFWEG